MKSLNLHSIYSIKSTAGARAYVGDTIHYDNNQLYKVTRITETQVWLKLPQWPKSAMYSIDSLNKSFKLL